MKNVTDAFTVRFHMQVRRVRDMYIKSICLYVFVSCKESTKRRQSAWTGVTSRQNHRLGIVWTKPSKSTANRSHLSSCIPRTLPLTPPPPEHTDHPSSGTYLETYVFAESSTPVSGNDYRTKYSGNHAIEESETRKNLERFGNALLFKSTLS